jgi:peptidoglycan LD-endopeptidase CwlK
MKDKITQDRINLLHPRVRPFAQAAFEEINKALTGRAICRLQEGLRTFETQRMYYEMGRTRVNPDGKSLKKPYGNIITNAKAGSSYHQYGLALDIVLLVDKDRNGTYETAVWDTVTDFDGDGKSDWMEAINILKKHGFTWGGDFRTFKDMPHVEMSFGLSVAKCLDRYNRGVFVPGTKYILI